MRANFLNSIDYGSMPPTGYYGSKQAKTKHKITENNYKNTTTRPAQAISFSGSAVSMAQKFVENGAANKLIAFINENEAAYNAIYALVLAGMLKPALVLAQTGFDDKDGQMIATKNFLQAFIGFFFSMTIGGGFIKKIYTAMDNNLKLLTHNGKGEIDVVAKNDPKALKIAEGILKKESINLSDKFNNAKEMATQSEGIKKVGNFIKGFMTAKAEVSEEQISKKAAEIVDNLRNNHLDNFKKNPEFTNKLIENMKLLAEKPSEARSALKQGAHIYDSFESFWKNSTGAITAIMKAKVSSMLLPGVVAFLFAKKNLEAAMAKKKNSAMGVVSPLTNSATFKKEQEKYSIVTAGKEADKNVNFKGSILNTAIDKSASVLEKAAMSNTGESLASGLSKISKKPSVIMGDVESFGITGYWLASTSMSKKIDPDQKLGLNAHTALVTVVSSIAAHLLDAVTDPVIKGVENAYSGKISETAKILQESLQNGATKEAIENIAKENVSKLYNSKAIIKAITDKDVLLSTKNIEETIDGLTYNYTKKLSKFKSLTIFTLVVRFLVPVLTVKASKKLKKKLVEMSKNMNKNKAEKTA